MWRRRSMKSLKKLLVRCAIGAWSISMRIMKAATIEAMVAASYPSAMIWLGMTWGLLPTSCVNFTHGKKWICMLESNKYARKIFWLETWCACISKHPSTTTFSLKHGFYRMKVLTWETIGSKVWIPRGLDATLISLSQMGSVKVKVFSYQKM